jgi:predicted membrane-bound dolichyl-phosphate-mannose-protein mannosyltransferase
MHAETAAPALRARGRSLYRVRASLGSRKVPLLLLGLLCVLSLGTRSVLLDQPCAKPCGRPGSYALVFDERYYVNAARRMLGDPVPAGNPYARAPAHVDPNSEHPQLAKLVIAAGIAIFGDRPLGWRLGSLVFGTLALIALYALVLAAGGSPSLALGAAAVMSLDNLFVVHGRIATLDIYALALMLVSGALYLRGRYVASGLLLALAACTKLVAFYSLFIFGLFELLGLLARRGRGSERADSIGDIPRRLAAWAATAVVGYTLLLALMDALMPAYEDGSGRRFQDPLHHTRHMFDYAIRLIGSSASEIASTPWQWLVNEKAINYFSVVRNSPTAGHGVAHTTVIAFEGAMNPAVIFIALPALFLAAHSAFRAAERIDLLAISWFGGLFLPLTLQSVTQHRTMYLYYMLIVLPGIYIAIARMFSRDRMPASGRLGYAVALVVGFVALYPFRTLSGF